MSKSKDKKPRTGESQAYKDAMNRVPPHRHKAQEVLAPKPVKLIDDGRKQSLYIIDTLAKTAMSIAGGEGAADKVAVIERMWAMQKDAEDRQAEREFGIAKVALAMELPVIPKNHKIEFVDKNNQKRETPYADRADIEGVLDPICRKHGFSKEYTTDTFDGKACQVLTVRHVGGHKEVYRSPYMPLDTSGSKNNNQAAGSTSEYGKRYALVGAFNIIGVDKDDDGNKGAHSTGKGEDPMTTRVMKESAPKTSADLFEAAKLLRAKLESAFTLADRAKVIAANVKILDALHEAGMVELAAELEQMAGEPANGA